MEENKIKALEGQMALWISKILLDADGQNIEKAEKWLHRAIDANLKNGQTWYLGQDYADYAGLFKRKNDYSKAREYFSKAIEIFQECGADGWVEKYEKELAFLQ
jgi:tetratricopeptide (TPR) repeat protein